MAQGDHIVALAGGVGGAKLAHGLYRSLPAGSLTVVVNTGDDFVHWGLNISPDLDTVMYTLAEVANEATGWGVKDESWNALAAMGRLGAETWFAIGDKDLATHLVRTQALRDGRSLTDITAEMGRALGIRASLLPMTDHVVATTVQTPDGWLAFQDYFVRRHHADPVLGVKMQGIEQASVTEEVMQAISGCDAVIFCPSNPIVSIGPILALRGMRELLTTCDAPLVAVSPIVRGKALRGPADTMLDALGHEASALGVARIYRDLISGMVIDRQDADQAEAIRALGIEALVTNTVMASIEDRDSLAATILDWSHALRARSTSRT